MSNMNNMQTCCPGCWATATGPSPGCDCATPTSQARTYAKVAAAGLKIIERAKKTQEKTEPLPTRKPAQTTTGQQK